MLVTTDSHDASLTRKTVIPEKQLKTHNRTNFELGGQAKCVPTFGYLIWFSMGRTTEIPSMAKMAVPKKSGNRSALANHGKLSAGQVWSRINLVLNSSLQLTLPSTKQSNCLASLLSYGGERGGWVHLYTIKKIGGQILLLTIPVWGHEVTGAENVVEYNAQTNWLDDVSKDWKGGQMLDL